MSDSYERNKGVGKEKYLIILFIGILVGTLFANLILKEDVLMNDNLYSYRKLLAEHNQFDIGSFIMYLICYRYLQMIVFIVLFFLFPKNFIKILLSLICGIIVGTVLSIQTMTDGIWGIISAILCMFPHDLCYVGGIILYIYFQNGQREIPKFIFLCICFFVGIMLEGIVNIKWIPMLF